METRQKNISEANRVYTFFNIIYVFFASLILVYSGIVGLRSWTLVIAVVIFFHLLSGVMWLVYKNNSRSEVVKYIATVPLSCLWFFIFLTTNILTSFALLFPLLIAFMLYSNLKPILVFGGFLVITVLAKVIKDVIYQEVPLNMFEGQINVVIITIAFVITTAIVAKYIVSLTNNLDTKLRKVTEVKEEQLMLLEEISASNTEMAATQSQLIATEKSKLVKSEEKLRQLAFIDTLTELPNKNAFKKFLHETIVNNQEQPAYFSAFILDLDNFKLINDSLGHPVGDLLLKKIAAILKNFASGIKQHFLARVGGDEFMLIVKNYEADTSPDNLANQLLQLFSASIAVDEYYFHVTASIGVGNFPEHGDSIATLMQNVEAAMYLAKKNGGNKYIQYYPDINKLNRERLVIKNELQIALSNNQFVLYYQPIVDNKTGAIVAVEALVRWLHPVKGLIPPNVFIPVAEETGQIIALGEWVISTALTQHKQWKMQGLAGLKIHINLSVNQLHHHKLYSFIKTTIAELKLNPAWIVLEITESVAVKSIDEAVIAINRLKTLGVLIALDDFGTGYSSLSYISKLPIDILKIDKSFINKLDNQTSFQITRLILELCNNTSILTTAEGVERDRQRNMLLKLKCDHIQGYLFSKPLSATDFMQFYQN